MKSDEYPEPVRDTLELLLVESDDATQPAVDTQPPLLLPIVLVAVFAVVALLVASDRGAGERTPTVTTSIQPPAQSLASSWPAPPEDHDPHVSTRPGAGLPVSGRLAEMTLVYVNDIDRPTVVDLGTGNQHELTISTQRAVDSFLVERGRIVTARSSNVNLPATEGRAFVIVVDRGEEGSDGDATLSAPAPRLCLNVTGCPDVPWTTGVFGDSTLRMESVPIIGEPWVALALALSATNWSQEGRWSTFELVGRGVSIRLPTPADYATIWLITDRSATVSP